MLAHKSYTNLGINATCVYRYRSNAKFSRIQKIIGKVFKRTEKIKKLTQKK